MRVVYVDVHHMQGYSLTLFLHDTELYFIFKELHPALLQVEHTHTHTRTWSVCLIQNAHSISRYTYISHDWFVEHQLKGKR